MMHDISVILPTATIQLCGWHDRTLRIPVEGLSCDGRPCEEL